MTDRNVAIDGGGTSAGVVLTDKAGVARHLLSGSGCNPQENPARRASLDPVFKPIPPGSAVVLGMSGFSEVPEIDDKMGSFIDACLNGRHRIMNDVELAFLSALPERDGVLLLAGT